MSDPAPQPSMTLKPGPNGPGLAFYQLADRHSHAFTGPAGENLVSSLDLSPEMESAEGPASPVFQEIHHEDLPQGPSLMLVGQWGKIHFSAVFLQESVNKFACDIAARVRLSGDVHLASTYTLRATATDLLEASGDLVVCRLGAAGVVRMTAGPGTEFVVAPAGHAGLRVQIFPTTIMADASSAAARTVRWSYTIELVNPDKIV
ncbi:MAG: hypothetical protein ACKO0V_22080 [bacterium]